jgi:hypothetical protein
MTIGISNRPDRFMTERSGSEGIGEESNPPKLGTFIKIREYLKVKKAGKSQSVTGLVLNFRNSGFY